jgi:phage terminase large subunit
MRPFFSERAPDGYLARYRVARGGRGSVKSWTIARALLLQGMIDELFIVCAREFQKSIRDSVHRLLTKQIDMLGLRDTEYVVRDTYVKNRNTGSEFVFYGLHHNVEAIKSLEGADRLWVEEAETVSANSWEVVDPTVRKPGSEIWVSFNPKDETDPTYQRFVKDPLPGTICVEVGWKDNPWLSDVLRRQAEEMQKRDPERFEHVWGGKTWFKNEAQVLNGKWGVAELDVPEIGVLQPDGSLWSGPYAGADWGFSQDPSALTKSFVQVLNPADIGLTMKNTKGETVPVPLRRNLYIAEEAFELGCETMSIPGKQRGLADLFDEITGARSMKWIGDNARPEVISHMNRVEKIRVDACNKWKGSVEDGITYLRGFERIFINPRCVHMIEEARLWSYKTDPLDTKRVLPVLKSGYDHGWDSVRYGHDGMIRKRAGRGSFTLSFPT